MYRRNFLKLATSLPFVPAVSLEEFVISYDGVGQYDNGFDYSQLYMSKEALEDIRNWGVDKLDEKTKKEIFDASL